MRDSYLLSLLNMRLLVGFLGERAQFDWWPTAFYEPSARLFLEPVFPKTSALAQCHGVVEAARRRHDEHLNVGSYHLFRLPEETEQDLHGLVQSEAGKAAAAEANRNKKAALAALESLAEANTPDAEGPVLVGSMQEIGSAAIVNRIAAIYRAAFASGTKAYPYLAG